MKRAIVVGVAMSFCLTLVGCGTKTNEGLISDTINMMESATTEIGNIKSRVKDAAEKARADPSAKLDLTDAIKATEKLKDVSTEAMTVKRNIERQRAKITDEEKAAYAEKQREPLNAQFAALLRAQTELRRQLADAESISANAKVEVDKLREKIQQAQSPFESIAR